MVFFSVFFSIGRRAAAVCASFGIYRVRWCMEPISFLVFGGDSFSMASVFLIRDFVPSLLMLNPNHSTCLHANIHLYNDIARFSSSSFFRTDCNFCFVDPNILLLRLVYRPNRHRCSYNL